MKKHINLMQQQEFHKEQPYIPITIGVLACIAMLIHHLVV